MKRFGRILALVLQTALDLLLPPGDDLLIVRRIPEAGLLPNMQVRIINAEEVEQHATRSGTPRIIALLPYPRSVVKACIRQAKFHDNARATQMLGDVLATFLRERIDPQCGSVCLVPIPLSQERLVTRGYNQAERIIRAALESRGLDNSFLIQDTIVRRVRDTMPQTTLQNHARQANLSGAFSCVASIDPTKAYVLVDDVTTTGTTFYEAAAALYFGGVKRLICVALAH